MAKARLTRVYSDNGEEIGRIRPCISDDGFSRVFQAWAGDSRRTDSCLIGRSYPSKQAAINAIKNVNP